MNILLWLRQDLRLADNPALQAALRERPNSLIFLYILPDNLGGASAWWLHHSLLAYQVELQKYGQQLLLSKEPAEILLPDLVSQYSIHALYCSERHEPLQVQADALLFERLRKMGLVVKCCPGYLLHNPRTLLTGQGRCYQKYTPFWRQCARQLMAYPNTTYLSRPPKALPPALPLHTAPQLITTEKIAAWGLCPTHPNWATGFSPLWTPGEQSAQKRLMQFMRSDVQAYATRRDYPAEEGTSRLSAHLHFGEISPHRVYHMAISQDIEDSFLKELMWREFAYHLLHHFPTLPTQAVNPQFVHFPWRTNKRAWQAWTQGETGYPIVDAGMRELWTTGWMHNRVRMIVASFLVKDLLINWRLGADWFLDTLVDADLANNSTNWQWVSGCGIDAAPYFRIFNPTLQSKKFDAAGIYLKKWLPELRHLSARAIHEPWLEKGKCHYPKPIVDHTQAREQALRFYQQIRKNKKN